MAYSQQPVRERIVIRQYEKVDSSEHDFEKIPFYPKLVTPPAKKKTKPAQRERGRPQPELKQLGGTVPHKCDIISHKNRQTQWYRFTRLCTQQLPFEYVYKNSVVSTPTQAATIICNVRKMIDDRICEFFRLGTFCIPTGNSEVCVHFSVHYTHTHRCAQIHCER